MESEIGGLDSKPNLDLQSSGPSLETGRIVSGGVHQVQRFARTACPQQRKGSSQRHGQPGGRTLVRRKDYVAMNNRGFSLLQLLLVVTIIAVVTSLSLIGITRSRQALQFSNATREFLAYAEKARQDSVRRHATPASADMANISVSSNKVYNVAIDFDGDGVVNAARAVTLPPGVTFSGNVPQVMAFNWRGRLVGADGNPTVPVLSLNDAGGSTNAISISANGDAGVSSGQDANLTPVNSSAPAVTAVSANTNLRGGTTVEQSSYSLP
ncbi:MAG: hypothetical protein QOD75_3556 [Blastocatellia bacterium]|jgi:type II secretory pathway pseudopilin PulG|nr:hypothetical protein [Blastocatellia bacterium]